ncbi:MAG: L-aspartate oxidase [Bdellovibrionales bacterium]|nr:L-aspartate oxidase [Bdellovibrionales bacterium]
MATDPPKVLIIGSGIAGLSAAIHFGEFSDVTVLTKSSADEGNTRYAQGGIAGVWSKNDSFEEHKKDTLAAGAGLCRESAVDICIEEGPDRIRELINWGVEFTRDPSSPNDYDLHREGGHHQRRILHAHDFTGLAIEETLIKKAKSNPRIRILENRMAVDLIMEGKLDPKPNTRELGRCLGAYSLDTTTNEITPIAADLTVIAGGGAGKVYLYTSNPDVATGDGIAMAHRAGARVANLEFMQFHPTCLYHPAAKNFLITEALRGEGAVLRNLNGHDFMRDHHEMGSLAPRYVVSQAIDLELKRSGAPHVWLDLSSMDESYFKTHFPQVQSMCEKFGIHPPRDYIPVVPAAHYLCGGILVDDWAQTSVPGLLAIGEAACTGLHGANRLASNSLLEGVVYSKRAAVRAKATLTSQELPKPPRPLPAWEFGRAVDMEEQIDIVATWREIRTLMWNYVGIVRSDRRLNRARERLALLRHEVNEDYWKFKVNRDLIELRNLLTVSELIVECAIRRKESRGLHLNVDYPTQIPEEAHDTII